MSRNRYSLALCAGMSAVLLFSCISRPAQAEASADLPEETTAAEEPLCVEAAMEREKETHSVPFLDSLGLVRVKDADSTLAVKLMYATPDNFTGQVLYDNLTEAYLHPDAAPALICAHKALKRLHPGYRLIVYDAARPMSVQKKMWNVVKGTPKNIYVSNPSHGGGLHNYGLAVDISILDSLGQPLPMGTEVDHMGIEAHISQETQLVKSGKITEAERRNRLLLRKVMKEGGFRPLPSEWWHFNLCSRNEARSKYSLIP